MGGLVNHIMRHRLTIARWRFYSVIVLWLVAVPFTIAVNFAGGWGPHVVLQLAAMLFASSALLVSWQHRAEVTSKVHTLAAWVQILAVITQLIVR